MKILHMISGGDSGGAKTHVFALMRKLPEYCDVKMVCFIKGQFFDELQEIDVQSELVEQKNRFDLSVVSRLKELCKRDGIQIIHAHGARANFIASHLKKHVDIPVVTTVHSDYLLDFDGLYKKIVFTALNTHALKKLDYYIGVSSSFKDMLISRDFRPNSIFTVYNGMDYSSPMEYCQKEEFGKRIGLEYDEKLTYVGLIGRHDRVKGHDIFLDAAKEVLKQNKNVRFVIAGDGEGRDALVEQAKTLGITEYLTFAGFVKDIYSFLNFVDINTLCSRCESFPYVLMEGARMAKPTISSAVGGIPDLVMDGKTGLLFEKENSKQFAQCILSLVEDKERAKSLGEALKEHAESNFSSDSLARTHRDIYSAILRDNSDKKKYDAVISGYYGYKNSGDDALLLGMIKSLKECKSDIRLAVLSKNPVETKYIYRVDSFSRFNVFSLRKAVKNTHLLINGGGSLIQDATSFKSLVYYLYVMHLAKKKGAKVFVYANGLGPLKDSSLKIVSKTLSKCADKITLRDAESVNELNRLGLGDMPYTLSADPALLLDVPQGDLCRKLLSKEGVPTDKKLMCVCVRPWDNNDERFEEKLAAVCDRANKNLGLVTVLLPMKPATDAKICRAIADKMTSESFVINNEVDVQSALGIISASYVSVGMRLHALIYSLCACVPSIGITYDPKVDGFADYIGNSMMVGADNIDENALYGFIENSFENHDEISEKMSVRLEELKQKAKESAQIAVDML